MELFQPVLNVQMLFLCIRREVTKLLTYLLPLFSKVYEEVVYDSLYNHVRNTISGSQHGFFKMCGGF